MTRGLLVCTAALTLAFLVSHVAGFREFTSVLSGTYPAAGVAVFGLAYAAVYMGFVILAPILVIGAGVLFILNLASAALGRR